MITVAADLHIHTVLSPCGDLEMSPRAIIQQAAAKELKIIAICDHNTLRHTELAVELGRRAGILVLRGVEITTREEAHLLALLPDQDSANQLELFLASRRPPIKNNPALFGYQVVVDEEDNILEEEEFLLISALNLSLEEATDRIHQLGGLVILAHVDKGKNSVPSQLGFIPPELEYEALELSWRGEAAAFLQNHSYLQEKTFIKSSDAHLIEDVGLGRTLFTLAELNFAEVRQALLKINGRSVALR